MCQIRTSGPAPVLFPALAPLMKRRAGLLSGGEQQMVAQHRELVEAHYLGTAVH